MQAERIELGEQVGYAFVKEVLQCAIGQWNHCIDVLLDQLTSADAFVSELREDDVEQSSEVVEQRIQEIQDSYTSKLKKIALKETSGSFLNLVSIYVNICIYMYKYICIYQYIVEINI